MTKDQYLEMMDQMNEEPDWDKCPPDWEDFPELVVTCVNIYHSMGDRIFPDVGFIGKDYTNLPYFISDYNTELKQLFIEILCWLDDKAIKKSSDKMKQEHEKLKRKHRG